MTRLHVRAGWLFVLMLLLQGRSWSAEERDLILVAGQSNAVGYDTRPADLPADPVDESVLFWWKCGDPPPDEHDSISGSKWTHLQIQPKGMPGQNRPGLGRQYGNFRFPEGGFGPEMGLARTLAAKEKRPLAVIKVAFSGTSVTNDWNPADPGEKGTCYRALVAETKAAIAAARERDIALRLRAIAWVQGESDANPAGVAVYEKTLGDLLAALRKELDAPEMVALLAVNTKFGGEQNRFMPGIVAAQKALAEKQERCVYVDTASAEIANSAHFSSAGTLDVGRRFAESLLQWEASRKGR